VVERFPLKPRDHERKDRADKTERGLSPWISRHV
jgi:hypothetical protein